MLRASLLFLVVPVVGCMGEHEYVDPSAGLQPAFGPGVQNLRFAGGSMRGDIGPVRNLSRNVTVSGYDDGVCTYVTIEGLGDNGHGTMVIDIMPRVDEMPEGRAGIGISDETYEGTVVSSVATLQGGEAHEASAYDGHVILRRLPNGAREIEVLADYGDNTASTAVFRMVPSP
jgi:hypothetical protein